MDDFEKAMQRALEMSWCFQHPGYERTDQNLIQNAFESGARWARGWRLERFDFMFEQWNKLKKENEVMREALTQIISTPTLEPDKPGPCSIAAVAMAQLDKDKEK